VLELLLLRRGAAREKRYFFGLVISFEATTV